MFYDLNIPWPGTLAAAPDPPKKGIKRKDPRIEKEKAAADKARDASAGLSPAQEEQLLGLLTDAAELGYHTVAFNFVVESRFDGSAHRCRFPPLATGEASPPFPALDPRCQTDAKRALSASPKIVQLTRMTLYLDEASLGKQGHGMLGNHQSELLKYDLLSVQPFNDASLSAVCLSMTELKPISIDIVSIDAAAAARTPFFLKRSLVNTAISNGAVFEICYSKALSSNGEGSSGDAGSKDSHLRARRNIISVMRDLLRVTNGKGVILSSGASDIMGLRGPYDVINLATIFGMNATAARDAISSTCRSLLLRAETRKTFRGVVGEPRIVAVPKESPSTSKDADTTQDTGTGETVAEDDSAEAPKTAAKRKQADDTAMDQSKAALTSVEKKAGKKRKVK